MNCLYSAFTAFVTGLWVICPGFVYAQKPPLRPAWVTKAAEPTLPSAWARKNPVRMWKYITRPTELRVQFPYMAVPNQAVWNIPRVNEVLERKLAWTQFPLAPITIYFPGKKEIDAVIFDLDGTLLDSLSAWEHSGSNFVRSRGLKPEPELDEELVSMSLLDGARLIKARYQLPDTPEEILTETLRPINEHYYKDIQPMLGVPELLARLRAQGVKMAVATAGDRTLAEAALKRLGLLNFFEFIITCDEVGVGKSSPAIYEAALTRLGTAKARTLVAEDALHALQTAYAAGFPTAAIDEVHSKHQRLEKAKAATYYVVSFQGKNVFPAGN